MNTKFLLLGAAVIMAPTMAFADHHMMQDGKMHDKDAWFAETDTDGDGAISWDEYKTKKEAWIKESFDKKDADGNGSVSKEEMEAAHAKMKEMHKEKMKKHMEKMDAPAE